MANSIFNYDNTLPGVITEIDSHLTSDYQPNEFGSTESVVVIGSALDGPTTCVPVYSVQMAYYLFGKAFDPETKKSLSLVTGIENCFAHGCKTVYAMRYNGIPMEKTFQLCATTEYKLRVQNRYPSNYSKQVYIKYDSTPGTETFTVYKPASRATIREKMMGLVEDENAVMVNEIRVNEDYSFDKSSPLADVINIVNNHAYNNVIELQIVDLDGNVVTNEEAVKDLTLGQVFPGVYFLGRQNSKCDKQTKVRTRLVTDDDDVNLYPGFKGKYYRSLLINTDVTAELPIYYNDVKKMRAILQEVGITMNTADDYLKVANESNKAFVPDKIDYCELNMNSFETYMRLGSGFATTAVAERRVGKDKDGNEIELVPKIHEADITDPQRVVATGDGVYSILQDTKIRYHVLNDVYADTVIKGKLPKHTDFKTTVNNSTMLMNGLIEASSKVDSNDETAAHSFNFRMFKTPEYNEINSDTIYAGNTAEIIGYSDDVVDVINAKPGDKYISGTALFVANEKGKYELAEEEKNAGLYLAGGKLFKATFADGALTIAQVTSNDEIEGKEYFIASQGSEAYVCAIGDLASETVFAADIDTALNGEEEKLCVMYEDAGVGANNVLISYQYFDTTSLGEFVDMLNESALNKKFVFELTQAGKLLQDEYVTDADAQAEKDAQAEAENDPTVEVQAQALADGTFVTMDVDRVRGYDYSKKIPYTTTDNFARQLAQHCTYTELRTFPTHGVISCSKVTDTSKASLAKKVAELKTFPWNMYIKNNAGRNLLNSDNLPYNIGRNISVPLIQEQFVTNTNSNAIVTGATAYAGFLSALPIDQSSTGQPINLVPMFEFNRTQLQTLSSLGVITAKNSFTQGFTICDGVTFASKDDVLRRFYNTRVMHFVEDYIRAACEPYIGIGNSSAHRNSLNTAITSNLNQIMDILIRSFEFTIENNEDSDQFDYINIHYVIVPMNEIREIRNFIRVQNN